MYCYFKILIQHCIQRVIIVDSDSEDEGLQINTNDGETDPPPSKKAKTSAPDNYSNFAAKMMVLFFLSDEKILGNWLSPVYIVPNYAFRYLIMKQYHN